MPRGAAPTPTPTHTMSSPVDVASAAESGEQHKQQQQQQQQQQEKPDENVTKNLTTEEPSTRRRRRASSLFRKGRLVRHSSVVRSVASHMRTTHFMGRNLEVRDDDDTITTTTTAIESGDLMLSSVDGGGDLHARRPSTSATTASRLERRRSSVEHVKGGCMSDFDHRYGQIANCFGVVDRVFDVYSLFRPVATAVLVLTVLISCSTLQRYYFWRYERSSNCKDNDGCDGHVLSVADFVLPVQIVVWVMFVVALWSFMLRYWRSAEVLDTSGIDGGPVMLSRQSSHDYDEENPNPLSFAEEKGQEMQQQQQRRPPNDALVDLALILPLDVAENSVCVVSATFARLDAALGIGLGKLRDTSMSGKGHVFLSLLHGEFVRVKSKLLSRLVVAALLVIGFIVLPCFVALRIWTSEATFDHANGEAVQYFAVSVVFEFIFTELGTLVIVVPVSMFILGTQLLAEVLKDWSVRVRYALQDLRQFRDLFAQQRTSLDFVLRQRYRQAIILEEFSKTWQRLLGPLVIFGVIVFWGLALIALTEAGTVDGDYLAAALSVFVALFIVLIRGAVMNREDRVLETLIDVRARYPSSSRTNFRKEWWALREELDTVLLGVQRQYLGFHIVGITVTIERVRHVCYLMVAFVLTVLQFTYFRRI